MLDNVWLLIYLSLPDGFIYHQDVQTGLQTAGTAAVWTVCVSEVEITWLTTTLHAGFSEESGHSL